MDDLEMDNQMNSGIKVWDIGVRLFHWSLVLFYTIAYISEDNELIHVYAGYVVLGLIAFRVVWGLIGTKYARFSNFIYGKRETINYFKSLFTRNPKRFLGHNPVGGWMILAMLVSILLVSWTGLELYADEGKGPLTGTSVEIFGMVHADGDEESHEDEESRESVWEEIHESLANLTLLLVFMHVAGVIVSSIFHRENLVKSMITGYKKPE